MKDTGIPALQDWCRQLTFASRDRSARQFLNGIKTFAVSIRQYLKGGEGVTAADRAILREKFETTVPNNLDLGDDEDDDEEDDDEMFDEYGFPLPRMDRDRDVSVAPAKKKDMFKGMKLDKDGNLVGITAQLAKVRSNVHLPCAI